MRSLCALFLVACAEIQPSLPLPLPGVSTSAIESLGKHDLGPAPPIALGPSTLELARRIDNLNDRTADPEHRNEAAALRAMANALTDLPKERFKAAALRELTDGAKALATSDSVVPARAALDATIDALMSRPKEKESGPVAQSTRQARLAVQQLDEQRPLMAQTPEVHMAMRHVARALALAVEDEKSPRDTSAIVRADVARARSDLEMLATNEGVDARLAAGRTLRSLAAVIETRTLPSISVQLSLVTMRSAADALQSSGVRHEDSIWVRRGLSATLDALVQNPAPGLMSWLESARSAVATISENAPFASQRASIQDAFRAVVETYAFATARD
jgi:hypothetical protein